MFLVGTNLDSALWMLAYWIKVNQTFAFKCILLTTEIFIVVITQNFLLRPFNCWDIMMSIISAIVVRNSNYTGCLTVCEQERTFVNNWIFLAPGVRATQTSWSWSEPTSSPTSVFLITNHHKGGYHHLSSIFFIFRTGLSLKGKIYIHVYEWVYIAAKCLKSGERPKVKFN